MYLLALECGTQQLIVEEWAPGSVVSRVHTLPEEPTLTAGEPLIIGARVGAEGALWVHGTAVFRGNASDLTSRYFGRLVQGQWEPMAGPPSREAGPIAGFAEAQGQQFVLTDGSVWQRAPGGDWQRLEQPAEPWSLLGLRSGRVFVTASDGLYELRAPDGATPIPGTSEAPPTAAAREDEPCLIHGLTLPPVEASTGASRAALARALHRALHGADTAILRDAAGEDVLLVGGADLERARTAFNSASPSEPYVYCYGAPDDGHSGRVVTLAEYARAP